MWVSGLQSQCIKNNKKLDGMVRKIMMVDCDGDVVFRSDCFKKESKKQLMVL